MTTLTCNCGHRFPAKLGRHGCPNCEGDKTAKPQCGWFLRCTRPAEKTLPHPVLGSVGVCLPCFDKVQRLSV